MGRRFSYLLIIFGLIYWPLEAWIHVLFFDEETFARQLLSPEPNELWMRLVVTVALIGFGLFARHAFARQEDLINQLQTQQERVRRVIETAHDAYVCIDEAGNVCEWNPSAEQLFGWKKNSVIGKSLAELIVPERYRPAHREGMKKYLASGNGPWLYRTIQTEALCRDGREIPIEMAIIPLAHEGGQEFYAFIRERV